MDTTPLVCPQCHTAMRPEYYYCFNCGKNLRPAPLSTSPMTQVGIYIGSVLLAPMGLVWGLRYIRQAGSKAKIIGVVSIVLTVITLIVMSKLIASYIYNVNEQVTKQLNGMQGF